MDTKEMNADVAKEKFEAFLKEKADLHFNEKSSLNEAILYSLLAPGKRIRPALALGFAHGFQGQIHEALVCAVAIEMIHTYSLIHDDLPSMDNDDFRRGRPTSHRVYGEALAILAGDSLMTKAPEFLITELSHLKVSQTKILELLKLLLEASGHQGMVKGQALDMKYEGEDLSKLDRKQLEIILREIHQLKTGSIITWSCLAGLYSHPDPKYIQEHFNTVNKIGNKIGLLFQMVDDVLDVTAELKDLGKTPGKDQKSGKLTYTNLLGLDGTIIEAKRIIATLENDLKALGESKNWNLILEIIRGLENKLCH